MAYYSSLHWHINFGRASSAVDLLAVSGPISVVGTLITDNLTDNFGISLGTTTIVFAAVLALVFAVGTQSKDSINTQHYDHP